MKRRLATIAAIAWTATSAFAAPPPPIWTGFYAGVNLGGGANTSTSVTTTGYSTFDWAAGVYNLPFGWVSGYRNGVAKVGQAGVVGGGQFGYNFQVSPNVVLGVETDFQGSGISGNGAS
jgi:outer membrane immunogenic protein